VEHHARGLDPVDRGFDVRLQVARLVRVGQRAVLRDCIAQSQRQQVRLSTQPAETLSKRQFLGLLEQMETDEMLVFATDYAHWDSDSPSRALPAGLPEELQRKILGGNALATFGARLLS
jgi:hypothetical protein